MIEFNTRKAEIEITRIQGRIDNQSQLLEAIGLVALNAVRENFNTESWNGAPWDPLTAAYALRKSRSPGVIQKKLQYSGRLINSIRYYTIGRDAVSVGSSVIYASLQNKKRPFLAPSPRTLAEMQKIAADYLTS